MLKYVETMVTFSEFPDEVTLCVNISGCPCHCEGCHSAYLADDIGTKLTLGELRRLIKKNDGITCVGLMGGDSDPRRINAMASWVRHHFHDLKVGWYSGRQELSREIDLMNFDFLKLGPYVRELGPLTSRSTNQVFYEVRYDDGDFRLVNKTKSFWRD